MDHDPATALFRGQVGMDDDGYIRTEPGTTRTSVEGVYAAGDAVEGLDQISVAMGTGARAAVAIHNDLRARDGQVLKD